MPTLSVCGKQSHLPHDPGGGPGQIALGLHQPIVQRTLAMLRRVGVAEPVLLAGGVAPNPCGRALIEEHLGLQVIVPELPDILDALGAALHGERMRRTAPAETVATP